MYTYGVEIESQGGVIQKLLEASYISSQGCSCIGPYLAEGKEIERKGGKRGGGRVRVFFCLLVYLGCLLGCAVVQMYTWGSEARNGARRAVSGAIFEGEDEQPGASIHVRPCGTSTDVAAEPFTFPAGKDDCLVACTLGSAVCD